MRKLGLLLAVTFIAALAVAGAAVASDELEFEADLSGANEVPAVMTDATGEAEIEVLGDTLTYELEVEDIENVVAAHIHAGAPGVNGPVIVDLGVPGNCEVDEDEIKCEATLTPANLDSVIANMAEGNAYVNVHTIQNPGGEVRGQISLD
jgi:hypothetical protein